MSTPRRSLPAATFSRRAAPWLACLAAAALPACAPPPSGPPPGAPSAAPAGLDLGSTRIVDLSHPIDAEMPLFPGMSPFATETLVTIEKDSYYANQFTMNEHAGTHVDAPAHFAAGRATVEKIAPAELVGNAAVVDVAAKVAQNPDYLLTVDDVRAWESKHGPLTAKHVVIVRTGWEARWSDAAKYRNEDAKGVMHFPGVSVEASRYLHERGVRCIGIDTLSTDPGPSKTFDEHRSFLAAGGYHVENLANLGALPEAGAVVVVAPLPLRRGSGAPARVLALVPGWAR